ncbi:MAG: hypothetical protein J6B54_03900 [Clostridia bacterium]|nr:hypothetical protein [Clostridia bacterium]
MGNYDQNSSAAPYGPAALRSCGSMALRLYGPAAQRLCGAVVKANLSSKCRPPRLCVFAQRESCA